MISGTLAAILAPAELEEITGFLDRDGFPPRPPLAVVFGQHEMIDIDLVPIFGQRLVVGDGIGRDGFVVFCLACGFAGLSFSTVALG